MKHLSQVADGRPSNAGVLQDADKEAAERGGGRKRTAKQDATLWRDLERLIEPLSRGDPEFPAALDLQERALKRAVEVAAAGGHNLLTI